MIDDEDPEQLDFPRNWDVLRDHAADAADAGDTARPEPEPRPTPPLLNTLAAAWADGVVTLAVCTAALLGLVAAGHGGPFRALGWAAVMAAAWWVFAASVLILVRHGTPGMLLAGVVFAEPVPPRRLAPVLVAAVVHTLLLGLPGLLGAARAPLALAAGSTLEAIPSE